MSANPKLSCPNELRNGSSILVAVARVMGTPSARTREPSHLVYSGAFILRVVNAMPALMFALFAGSSEVGRRRYCMVRFGEQRAPGRGQGVAYIRNEVFEPEVSGIWICEVVDRIQFLQSWHERKVSLVLPIHLSGSGSNSP